MINNQKITMYKSIDLVSRIKYRFAEQDLKIKSTVVAGDCKSIKQLINEISKNKAVENRFIQFCINSIGKPDLMVKDMVPPGENECCKTLSNLEKIDEIIIAEACEKYCSIFELMERYRNTEIKVHISPGKYRDIPNIVIGKRFYGLNLISIPPGKNKYSFSLLKRMLDLVITVPALLLLLPLILSISVIIKLTSKGTVFYLSERIGCKGKPFIMYKFRTMKELKQDDEERKQMMLEFMKKNKSSGNDTKIVNSMRITKIGRLLRKTSLDELPQLFNVLKGEMSLVGPRPCIPYEYENYEEWQKKRSDIPPGCTGLWQISGRSIVTFDESVFLDLMYKYSCSFLTDLKIILRTLPVMIFSHGGR